MNVTRNVNRPRPIGPSHAYQTFAVKSPMATHFRKATCPEVNCKAYQEGWTVRVQHLDERLWAAIKASGRRYRRYDLTEDEGYLAFDPGQLCFQVDEHRVRTDRPEIFLVGRGDWRSFKPSQAERMQPEHWVERLYGHLDLLKTNIQKG